MRRLLLGIVFVESFFSMGLLVSDLPVTSLPTACANGTHSTPRQSHFRLVASLADKPS
jgi:hypothetical protein